MVKKATGGRPSKGREPRTSPLALRIEPELRNMLNKAVAEAGNSLTSEVHRRLRMSFDQFAAFGNQQNYERCRLIANLMVELTKIAGKSWDEDAWVFEQFRQGLVLMLQAWDPIGSPAPDMQRQKPSPPSGKGELPDKLGESLAFQQLVF